MAFVLAKRCLSEAVCKKFHLHRGSPRGPNDTFPEGFKKFMVAFVTEQIYVGLALYQHAQFHQLSICRISNFKA